MFKYNEPDSHTVDHYFVTVPHEVHFMKVINKIRNRDKPTVSTIISNPDGISSLSDKASRNLASNKQSNPLRDFLTRSTGLVISLSRYRKFPCSPMSLILRRRMVCIRSVLVYLRTLGHIYLQSWQICLTVV